MDKRTHSGDGSDDDNEDICPDTSFNSQHQTLTVQSRPDLNSQDRTLTAQTQTWTLTAHAART